MGRSRLRASAPHWAPRQNRRSDRRPDSHSVTKSIPPSPCQQTRRQPQHRAMPQRARRQPKPQRPLSAGVEIEGPPRKSREQCTLPTPVEMNPACVLSTIAATNMDASGAPSPTVSTKGCSLASLCHRSSRLKLWTCSVRERPCWMSWTTLNGTRDGSPGPCTSRRRTSPPRHPNDFRKADPWSSLVEQAHRHAISTGQVEIARDPLTAGRLTGTDDPARSAGQSVMTWSGGLPPNASYS